jgi:very-short-patch-repair endonuclease
LGAALTFPMKQRTKKTSLENKFAEQLMESGFKGRYRRNHPFIEGRRFQADFWFGALRLVVEVDGGEWLGKNGGHTSGAGMRADRERDGLAALQHIQTIRYVGAQVKDGSAIAHLCQYAPVRTKEVEALKAQGLI